MTKYDSAKFHSTSHPVCPDLSRAPESLIPFRGAARSILSASWRILPLLAVRFAVRKISTDPYNEKWLGLESLHQGKAPTRDTSWTYRLTFELVASLCSPQVRKIQKIVEAGAQKGAPDVLHVSITLSFDSNHLGSAIKSHSNLIPTL